MRPLHRVANWRPSPVRVPVIACVLTFALCGFLCYGAAELWVNAPGLYSSDNQTLAIIGACVLFVAGTIQLLFLLWKWEEKRSRDKSSGLQERIDKLESELGMK
jgi:membrane protein implicated in regulation of membrane protease activity